MRPALSPRYLITPEPAGRDRRDFLAHIERALAANVGMVQLRSKHLSSSDFLRLAGQIHPLTQAANALLILNHPHSPDYWKIAGKSAVDDGRKAQSAPEILPADGLHLGSVALMALNGRPAHPRPLVLSVACHDAAQLAHAVAVCADCATLSPVHRTATHPDAVPLGWETFERLARGAADAPAPTHPLRIYALGGIRPDDLVMARQHGAYGIAGISGFW